MLSNSKVPPNNSSLRASGKCGGIRSNFISSTPLKISSSLKRKFCHEVLDEDESRIHPEFESAFLSSQDSFRAISPDTVVDGHADTPKKLSLFPVLSTPESISSAPPEKCFAISWDSMVELMKTYGSENGHYEIPWNYKCSLVDGTKVNLGVWLGNQYQLLNKGMLTMYQLNKLEELFDFGERFLSYTCTSSDDMEMIFETLLLCERCDVLCDYEINLRRDSTWDTLFNILLSYVAAEGHCEMPLSYECHTADGTVLRIGAWFDYQKQLKLDGLLLLEREAKLETLLRKTCKAGSDL